MPHSPSLFLLCTFTVYIVSYLQRRRVARRRFVRKLHSGRKAIEARQPTYESGQLTQSRPPMNSDYDWLACHAHARSRPIFISLVYARWRTRGDGDTHDRGVCCTTSGYFSINWVSARRRKKKPHATRMFATEREPTFQINPAAASYDARIGRKDGT